VIDNADDVGVSRCLAKNDLFFEAPAPIACRQLGTEHLDRERAPVAVDALGDTTGPALA